MSRNFSLSFKNELVLMSALYFLLVQKNNYKCQVLFNYAFTEKHVLKCFLESGPKDHICFELY